MKADIHPAYFENLKITCACGNIIIAGSTRKELRTELCSACHPFYTGKQKLIDTAGRVDKFLEKVKKMQAMKAKKVEAADVTNMEQTFESETVEFAAEAARELPKKIADKKTKAKAAKAKVGTGRDLSVKAKKTAAKPKKTISPPKKKTAGKKTAAVKKLTKTKK